MIQQAEVRISTQVLVIIPISILLLYIGWNITGFWYYEIIALSFLGIVLLLLTARPIFCLWLLAWLVAVLAYSSHQHIIHLGRSLTYHSLVDPYTAAIVITDFATPEVFIAGMMGLGIAICGILERPAVRFFKARAGLILTCAVASALLVVLASRTALTPFSYSGKYDRGRAVFRLLIGSTFDLKALSEPVAFRGSEWCCMQRSPENLTPITPVNKSAHLIIILLESSFEALWSFSESAAATPSLPHSLPLQVHALGGHTWRSEYAVLHGLPDPVYGPSGAYVNILGPNYLDGALPRTLAAAGFATATISTTGPAFYGSERMHRSLGMAEFMSCSDDPVCARLRRTDVPDTWLYQRAIAWLDTLPPGKPGFVFGTTIRQHSPHLPSGDRRSTPIEATAQVMREFNRRQSLSMAEWDEFLRLLQRREDRVVVIAFGDHIPADVYRFVPSDTLVHPKRTHFTVFDNRLGYITTSMSMELGVRDVLDIAHLDLVALRALGIETRYSQKKREILRQYGGGFPPEIFNSP